MTTPLLIARAERHISRSLASIALIALPLVVANGCSSDASSPPGGTAGSAAGAPASGAPAATAGAGADGTTTAGGVSGTSAGGASGGAGATSPGGGPGIAGSSPGSAGSGGAPSTGMHGSSNKVNCAAGATYGSPLAGMGAVVSISAPTTGPATYFAFIEGPLWVRTQGAVLFSDNASQPQERIWALTPPSTTPTIFLEMSGSNGLALDNQDKVIIADQRNHRITRVDPASPGTPEVVVPAGAFTPNDVIVRGDGNIYFTDPNSAGKGFYRVSPTGTLTGPITLVGAPNGIELNADESTLYVGDVNNKTVYTFSLASDGAVNTASMATFVTATGNTVDGMATDCAGNLYLGTQSGIEVYSPSKTLVGTIPTGESSNCTFGGADRKTLYVTSRSVLKAVTLGVPGLPD